MIAEFFLLGRKLISRSRGTFAVDLVFTISCFRDLQSPPIAANADANINKNSSSPKNLRFVYFLSRFELHEIGARTLHSESSAIASVISLLLLSIANDLFRFSLASMFYSPHTLLFKITHTLALDSTLFCFELFY